MLVGVSTYCGFVFFLSIHVSPSMAALSCLSLCFRSFAFLALLSRSAGLVAVFAVCLHIRGVWCLPVYHFSSPSFEFVSRVRVLSSICLQFIFNSSLACLLIVARLWVGWDGGVCSYLFVITTNLVVVTCLLVSLLHMIIMFHVGLRWCISCERFIYYV